MLTFQEAQKKCKELSPHPCAGKGITKDFLLSFLTKNQVTYPVQKEIQEHNPEFYAAIKPYVNLMPDFRPARTMKYMKEEPQNNWHLIYDELNALSYQADHIDVMEDINSDIRKRITPYVEKRELLKEFFFTYPALTWLMTKIFSSRIIFPLLIASGMYLDYIPNEKINDDITSFIRDKETAEKLYNRVPYTIDINILSFLHAISEGNIGHVYWFLVSRKINMEKYRFDILTYGIRSDNHFILSLLLDHIQSTKLNSNLITIAVSYSPETMHVLLKDRRMDPMVNKNAPLLKAIREKREDIVKILLSNDRVDPSIPNNLVIQKAATSSPKIIELLLEDKRVDPTVNDYQLLYYGTAYLPLTTTKMIIDHPQIDPQIALNIIFESAVIHDRIDIVDDILSNPNINLSEVSQISLEAAV